MKKPKLPIHDSDIKSYIREHFYLEDSLTPSRYSVGRRAAKGHGSSGDDRRALAIEYIATCALEDVEKDIAAIIEPSIDNAQYNHWRELVYDVAADMVQEKWKSLRYSFKSQQV